MISMRSVSEAFSLLTRHAERTTTGFQELELLSLSRAEVTYCFIVILFAYTLRGGTGFGAAIAMLLLATGAAPELESRHLTARRLSENARLNHAVPAGTLLAYPASFR
jgi:hypothetical protein